MRNINERIDAVIFNKFSILTSITYTHIIAFIPAYFNIYSEDNLVNKIIDNRREFSRESLH